MGSAAYLGRREGLVLLVLQLAGRLGLNDQVFPPPSPHPPSFVGDLQIASIALIHVVQKIRTFARTSSLSWNFNLVTLSPRDRSFWALVLVVSWFETLICARFWQWVFIHYVDLLTRSIHVALPVCQVAFRRILCSEVVDRYFGRKACE